MNTSNNYYQSFINKDVTYTTGYCVVMLDSKDLWRLSWEAGREVDKKKQVLK